VRAEWLVDVSGLADMRTAEQRSAGLWIGGAITHAEIEDGKLDGLLARALPLARMLRHVAGTIAYRAIRNRGTLAGSLAHADPAADWVLAMTVLDAQLDCGAAQAGRMVPRMIPMTRFMSGAFTTALQGGELLAGVLVPYYSSAMRWGYYKFCRKTGEFAEASCAVLFDPEQGVARIAIGALDGAPVLLEGLAGAIAQGGIDAMSDEAVRDAVARAAPGKDLVGQGLIATAVKRGVRQALEAA
jgi:carbon-monoxide dehydrogenase medium subunit